MTDNIITKPTNEILASLPDEVLDRIYPLLEMVETPLGTILYHSGSEIPYVYFPERSMISVVAYTQDGQGAEVAVVGREGATGLDVILGSDYTTSHHVAQIGNVGYRMKTSDVRAEFKRNTEFHDRLLHFTRKFIVQISQTALCNRLHITEKRLSRWLLMCRDRSDSNVLHLTQEFISIMLGANRTTVTMTAIELQNLGLIKYSRGLLTIVDREGLEAFSCDCYATIRDAYSEPA